MVCRFRLLIIVAIIFSNIINAQAFGTIRDSEIEEAISLITQPLIKASGLDAKAIKVYIYNSDELNAFVAGGQNMFLSSALISFSQDPELLAGVVAHELGHIKSGHLLAFSQEYKNAQNKMILSTVIGVATAVIGGSSGAGMGVIAASQDGAMRELMRFSRSQESAADAIGVKTLNKIGVSTDKLAEFLTHLHNNFDKFSDKDKHYLRSHPLSLDRINYINSKGKYHGRTGFSAKVREKFALASIKTALFTRDLKEIKSVKIKDNDYLNAIIDFRFARYAKAETALNKAIDENPNNRFLYELLGEIYKEQGKYKKALEMFEKAYKFERSDNLIKCLYAESLFRANEKISVSRRLLEEAIQTESRNNGAWKILSQINNKLRNNSHSSLCNAWSEYLLGNLKLSRKHLNTVSDNTFNNDKFYIRQYVQLKDLIEFAKIDSDD